MLSDVGKQILEDMREMDNDIVSFFRIDGKLYILYPNNLHVRWREMSAEFRDTFRERVMDELYEDGPSHVPDKGWPTNPFP